MTELPNTIEARLDTINESSTPDLLNILAGHDLMTDEIDDAVKEYDENSETNDTQDHLSLALMLTNGIDALLYGMLIKRELKLRSTV